MKGLFDFFEFHHYKDKEGRPLSEEFNEGEKLKKEMITCPFRDERDGQLMNVSAWNQFIKNKEEVSDWFSWARFLTSNLTEDKGTIKQLWICSLSLRWIVHFRLFKDKSYEISGGLASTYKITRGIHDLLVHASIEFGSNYKPTKLELMNILKKRSLLISTSGVCAAPKKIIELYIERLFVDDNSTNSLIPDGILLSNDDYFEYLDIYSSLERLCGLFVIDKKNERPVSISNINANVSSEMEMARLFGLVTPIGFYTGNDNVFKFKNIEFLTMTGREVSEESILSNIKNLEVRLGEII